MRNRSPSAKSTARRGLAGLAVLSLSLSLSGDAVAEARRPPRRRHVVVPRRAVPRSRGQGPAVELRAAEAALAAGRLAEAEEHATAATAQDPTLARAWQVAGLCAFKQGAIGRARDRFEQQAAREREPAARALAAFNVAAAEVALSRFVEAEREYEVAAVDGTGTALEPLAHLEAGLAAERAGDATRAAAHYRDAMRSGTRHDESPLVDSARDRLAAIEARAEAERVQGRRDEAYRLARAGTASLRAGDSAAAVASLERAAAIAKAVPMPAKHRADIDYSLGDALLAARRPQDALEPLRRAVASQPRDGALAFLYGVALDRAGQPVAAREALTAALAHGLPPRDAAHARDYLERAADPEREPSRVTLETQLSAGYDTDYAGGREAPFRTSASRAAADVGAPEIAFVVEPRLRLAGTSLRGLVLGDRVTGLLYLLPDADPYSLLEEALYLEGGMAPRAWLSLAATVEGYLQTSGLATFGLYQTGAVLSLRAQLLEGARFATRLRYAAGCLRALSPPGPLSYDYMTGWHQDVSAAESFYVGRFRLSLAALLQLDLVGVETEAASDVIGAAGDALLHARLGVGADVEPTYAIPYSFFGGGVGVDGEGDVRGGLHLVFGARYEHRRFLDAIAIAPDPGTGYHALRVDDRLSLDGSVRRAIGLGFDARLSLYLLVSRSNVQNRDPAFPFDFDDKNYLRFVGTLDVLRAF